MDEGQAATAAGSTVADLVGRDRERALLRRNLDSALSGRGSLILIGGEAGIGKTTLVEDLARAATERGCLVLVGRCYDLSTTPPYGPWLEIVRDSPHVDGLPSLSAILTRDVTEDAPAARAQAELYAWAEQLMRALAQRQPLLLVLDDLHWADQASLDFLRHFSRGLARLPILLATTYRDDEITRRHPLFTLLPLLVREAPTERVHVSRLSDDEVWSWVATRYALGDADERRLVTYVCRYADGNPFFIAELLRSLEDEQLLSRGNDGYRLGDLASVRVPDLLRQVIERRLDHLRPASRELLSVAAVIGQGVPLGLWSAVAATDEDAITRAMADALDLRLMTSNAARGATAFAHALIREALYQDIILPRRQVWHQRVAECLLSTPSPDPDEVAHHLRLAGDPRAATWLARAGDRAYYEAFALQTAAARYEAALDLLGTRQEVLQERGWLLVKLALARRFSDPRPSLPLLTDAIEIAERVGDRALHGIARWNRGVLRVYAGKHGLTDAEAGHRALCGLEPGERQRLQRELSSRANDPLYRQAIMVGWYVGFGRPAEALSRADAIEAELRAGGHDQSPHVGYVHFGRAGALSALGRPVEARAELQRGRQIFEEHGFNYHVHTAIAFELYWNVLPYFADDLDERRRRAELLQDYAARGLREVTSHVERIVLAPLLMVEGRWDELAAAIAAQTEGQHSYFYWMWAAPAWATVLRHTGRYAEARRLLLDFLPEGDATDVRNAGWFPRDMELFRLAANLALDEGDPTTARRWLLAHDRWVEWSGWVQGRAEGQLIWSRYHETTGDPRAAIERAWAALRLAGEPRQPLALLAVERALGELHMRSGRVEAAGEHLTAALSLAEACAAPFERALTLLAHARQALVAGRCDDARQALDAASALCERLGARPALAQASALRHELDARDASPLLSPRERDVLTLVSEGLTDREIADRLYISPRTVSQHLRSIYNKLGVTTRAAATRTALEQGLIA